MTATATITTCTVVTGAAQGGEFPRCGAPAEAAGIFATGTVWGVCQAHSTGPDRRAAGIGADGIGQPVTIHRNGRTYIGTVTRVGPRGAKYARFTYDNGNSREVRVCASQEAFSTEVTA